jgi:hypothetical protein
MNFGQITDDPTDDLDDLLIHIYIFANIILVKFVMSARTIKSRDFR